MSADQHPRPDFVKRARDALVSVQTILPANFDVDEGPCVVCGGQLDTGWECNDCGADHFPAVHILLSKKRRLGEKPKCP